MFQKVSTLVGLLMLVFLAGPVASKRGPHHPRGELEKVNEHIVHSDEHLKADLRALHVRPEKPVEEMSEDEKQFYHFKMHDYDNNNLLDGLEILQSANAHDDTLHGHHKMQKPTTATADNNDDDNEGGAGSEELGLQHLVDIIDDFLLVADKNNDGYLNFNEYKETLRRDSTDQELGAGHHPGDDNDVQQQLNDVGGGDDK